MELDLSYLPKFLFFVGHYRYKFRGGCRILVKPGVDMNNPSDEEEGRALCAREFFCGVHSCFSTSTHCTYRAIVCTLRVTGVVR